MIKITNLTKTFAGRQALKGVSFSLDPGEKVALLGPNGAGKSTLMSLLSAFRKPTLGEIKILDLPPGHQRLKSQVGFCLQENDFPSHSRVEEIMSWVASHYSQPLALDSLAQSFDLSHLMRRQAGGLSGGEKRRLGLALAFVGRPRVVLLDEPTTAVDLENRHRFYDFVSEYVAREKITLLFSTHQMDEAERLGDRLIILHKGQLLRESTPQGLKALLQSRQMRLRSPQVDLRNLDAAWALEGNDFYICWDSQPEQRLKTLFEQKIEFSHLEVSSPSIEEAFIHLTNEIPTGGPT